MHAAPQCLAQLEGRNNLTRVSNEEAQRRQLPGGQVNDCISAQEGAIELQPEASKGKPRLSTPASRI
jgi:hypothetical protein